MTPGQTSADCRANDRIEAGAVAAACENPDSFVFLSMWRHVFKIIRQSAARFKGLKGMAKVIADGCLAAYDQFGNAQSGLGIGYRSLLTIFTASAQSPAKISAYAIDLA